MHQITIHRHKFEQTGNLADLNEAIRITEELLETEGDRARHGLFGNFGNLLYTRFIQTESMDDLRRAIDAETMATEAAPEDDDDRATYASNLGIMLKDLAERSGSIDDLRHAIDLATAAADAISHDHEGRPTILTNIALMLKQRFEQTRSMDDLNQAINAATAAVDRAPQKHPRRPIFLNNLGMMYCNRYQYTKSIDDLNKGIDQIMMAADISKDPSNQFSCSLNVGVCFLMRYEENKSLDDLNRAIDSSKTTLSTLPEHHLHRSKVMNSLGQCLAIRARDTESLDDLNQAVDILTSASNLAPKNDAARTLALRYLGSYLEDRFEWTGSIDDRDRAVSSYREVYDGATSPSMRIDAACAAARILASQDNWTEANKEYQKAIRLLPQTSPRSLKHIDAQMTLKDVAAMPSRAVSAALNAGEDAYHALLLLEMSRGVIAGSLMEMREDISQLTLDHPGLAAKFMSLRDELDAPVDSLSTLATADHICSWEIQASRRRRADEEFSELIATIRAQPGFDNFLQPPTAEELQSAADPDPIVVINANAYRCDAFLVERDRIRVIPLPAMNMEGDVADHFGNVVQSHAAKTLQPLLEWLWDVACRPCLDALGFSTPIADDKWPHVWWIPTGFLEHFPFHAAGYHTRNSGETVLDRVMSSYSPSIRALLHGRRIRAVPQTDSALLVAMEETPGMNGTLGCARAELNVLKDLCPSLRLNPVMPPSRKEDVLDILKQCKVFHFAGHGKVDYREPSQSSLLLKDWMTNPLTAEDLRNSRLQEHPPFLAYLSACSTGTNFEIDLIDEGIHLAGAFQLAGFRHVIGTRWEVKDEYCVYVAKIFYETLRQEGMTDVAVYRGLHRAVRALRDEEMSQKEELRHAELTSIGIPPPESIPPPEKGMGLSWVPFIHYGV